MHEIKPPQAVHRPTPLSARIRHKLSAIALTAMTLLAANVHADDSAAPMFSFSGFGTLGLTHSSEKEADFVAHDLQGGGAGRDHEWSSDVDSKLGLQLTANPTDKISGVVQVIAEQRYDGTMRPGVEWANLKYQFTPDFSVRAGRIVLPLSLTSDTRKIGYAQPWVRPPVELYSLIPLTKSDGVDVSYRLRWGDVQHNLKAAYGGSDERHPDGGKIKVRDGWLLADTVEYGATTFHVAYSRSQVTIEPFAELTDGYRAIAAGSALFAANPFLAPFAPQFNAASAAAERIADKYDAEDTLMEVFSIGASYDPGSWFVMGEWGQAKSDSVFGKRQAWYTTTGFRWGKFTPYLTYARAHLKSADSDAGVTIPGVALLAGDPDYQALVGGAAMANAGLNGALAGAPKQRTVSIGVRWDFAKNAAFKLQYDHATIGDGSTGTLDHQTDDFKYGKRFDVWSATVDFVF